MFDFKKDAQRITALPLKRIFADVDLRAEEPAIFAELLRRLSEERAEVRR